VGAATERDRLDVAPVRVEPVRVAVARRIPVGGAEQHGQRCAIVDLLLTCPDGRRGTTTWAEWLSRHPAGSD
jgi:hypothetical protein